MTNENQSLPQKSFHLPSALREQAFLPEVLLEAPAGPPHPNAPSTCSLNGIQATRG